MTRQKKLPFKVLSELFFGGILLLVFAVQAFLGACLLLVGYIPIPAAWADRFLAKNAPEGLHFHVETVRLYRGGISVTGLDIHTPEIDRKLASVQSLELDLEWQNLWSPPQVHEVSASGGTVFMPAIHVRDGRDTPLLERIAFKLKPDESGWKITRLAALHDEVRLWGSIALPRRRADTTVDVPAALDQFYTLLPRFLEEKKRFEYFETPTVVFAVNPLDPKGHFTVSLRASSPELNHPEIEADNIQLEGLLIWDNFELSALEAPVLSASRVRAPGYDLEALGARIQIPADQFGPTLQGNWPQFQLAASQLILPKYKIDAPILELDAAEFPEIKFLGTAGGLSGAVALDGRVDTRDWSGSVHARGSIDLAELASQEFLDRLPAFRFHQTPYYDLHVNFDSGLSLADVHLDADIKGLQIEGIHFEQIRAGGSYADDRFSIDALSLRRDKQWLDLTFELDQESRDYRVGLTGSVVPNDYNALLPEWWTAIFRDFDFSAADSSRGDFIIYGNTQQKAAELYFGHVAASNVTYRGVMLDKGSLVVRGRGPYTEIKDLEVSSGKGWARGDIAFASRLDTVKGPASVRLDLDAALTLADASRLFGADVANLINTFETEALPTIKLQAAFFNPAYPELRDKSHFTLHANCPAPLTYRGIPFEDLAFRLYGRSDAFHIRDLRFGYANGEGDAMVDIATSPDQSAQLRYQVNLVHAEQNLALANLPQFGDIRQSLQPADKPPPEDEIEDTKVARVDLQLHGQGPADDIWAHRGFGRFAIRNERLATIQLLGPLSKLLQNTELNFTSFNLETMHGDFTYRDDIAQLDPLQIDGQRTKIKAPGSVNLRDQSIDMRVSIFLFGNAGDPDSRLRQLGDLLKRPIPNLLEFELSGTLENQRFRSLYDPRNLIPNL